MEASYKFGPYKIDSREVFHATPLSSRVLFPTLLLQSVVATALLVATEKGQKKFSSFGKCGPAKVTWIKQRLPNVE
jgi:bis(5'-adenosyl)-triphosphatase